MLKILIPIAIILVLVIVRVAYSYGETKGREKLFAKILTDVLFQIYKETLEEKLTNGSLEELLNNLKKEERENENDDDK